MRNFSFNCTYLVKPLSQYWTVNGVEYNASSIVPKNGLYISYFYAVIDQPSQIECVGMFDVGNFSKSIRLQGSDHESL